MSETPSFDQEHMRKALGLARAGVGLVSPNPAVGAVVLDASGREVGTGTHTYDGVKHAEVLALEQATHPRAAARSTSTSNHAHIRAALRPVPTP